MMDSYGDGWNGHYWHWEGSNGNDVATGTLPGSGFVPGGITGYDNLCYPGNETCTTFYVDGAGTYPYEISWDVADAPGATVASGGANSVTFPIGCPPPPAASPVFPPTLAPTTGTPAPTQAARLALVKDYSSFESDFDGWSTDVTGDVPFSRTTGSTGSLSTGPAAAADGAFYVYAETSAGNQNVNFDLEKTFPLGQEGSA